MSRKINCVTKGWRGTQEKFIGIKQIPAAIKGESCWQEEKRGKVLTGGTQLMMVMMGATTVIANLRMIFSVAVRGGGNDAHGDGYQLSQRGIER